MKAWVFREAVYSNEASDRLMNDFVMQEAVQVVMTAKRNAMSLEQPVFITVKFWNNLYLFSYRCVIWKHPVYVNYVSRGLNIDINI